VEQNFKQFLDNTVANAPPELRDVHFESRQNTMVRAVAAGSGGIYQNNLWRFGEESLN
jgi:hypothetical protein